MEQSQEYSPRVPLDGKALATGTPIESRPQKPRQSIQRRFAKAAEKEIEGAIKLTNSQAFGQARLNTGYVVTAIRSLPIDIYLLV